ncbi:MAG: ABC transporter substrate-binding protein [Actinomycetales bacterium]|nr:ABC transporter substrate-binding protein [Actinomycetales bacterium]
MRARPGTWIGAALALALVAGALGGCAAATPQDRPVIVGAIEPSQGIRPDCADIGCTTIAPALLGTLAVLGPDGELELELAESIRSAPELLAAGVEGPSAEEDPRVEIVVREGARFADGEPITAQSFVDSWRRIAGTAEDARTATLFAPFRGYTADPEVDLVDSGALEVVDERTFVVHLERPMADFPAELTLPLFAPRTAAELSGGGDPRDPAASGPYRVADGGWQPGERLQLVPNPAYRGPRTPRNAGLDLRFLGDPDVTLGEFLVGDLDLVAPLPSSRWSGAASVLGDRIITGVLPELIAISFPADLGAFAGQDGLLRREALALAIDRPDLASGPLGGHALAADAFLPRRDGEAAFEVPHDQTRAEGSWQDAEAISTFTGSLAVVRIGEDVPSGVADSIVDMLDATIRDPVEAAHYVSEGSYRAATDPEVEDHDPRGVLLVRAVAASPAWSAFLEPGSLLPDGALTGDDAELLAAVRDAGSYADARAALEAAQAGLAQSLPVIPLAVPLGAVAASPRLADVQLGWDAVPRWDAIRVLD